MRGSSPLTRGAPRREDEKKRRARLIPAHAGSTTRGQWPPPARSAHPRSRGEHFGVGADCFAYLGSSPLTRGARIPVRKITSQSGLIPAHAGSTPPGMPTKWCWWAHPRSRGEHLFGAFHRIGDGGSSPLTRGALTHGWSFLSFVRLIPAHAGSTVRGQFSSFGDGAHPRSRGEHSFAAWSSGISNGSSPLTRGAQPRTISTSIPFRLIPAHAGSTPQATPSTA